MRNKTLTRWLAATALLAASATAPAAATDRSLCVFDVIGANGDVYQLMTDYALAAKEWGVNLRLRAYTEESLAMADFQSGRCDAVVLTGIRNRALVPFPGSLDMMAAKPTYEHARMAYSVVHSERAAELMRNEAYETVGVVPGGMVYLFGKQGEALPDWNRLAGSRVAIMSYDEQASEMVRYVGGAVVPASPSTFAGMFNSGSVDLAYAPAFAYTALEMYRGLGENGGILNYNLGILSFQINTRWERFPDDFGQQSRNWVMGNLWDQGMRLIEQAEAEIPDHYWIELDDAARESYNQMFADVRQALWDQGVYSQRTQSLLKQIRCRLEAGRAECSADTEGGPVGG